MKISENIKSKTLNRSRRNVLLILAVLLIISAICFIVYQNHQAMPDLTPAEREWLNKHDGKITISGDPFYAPIDFINENGSQDGIAEDFVVQIEKKLNTKFKRVNYSSWTEVLEKTKTGENDIAKCIAPNEERLKIYNFTESYFEIPTVIVVNKNDIGIKTITDLKDKRVAIPLNYASYEHFKKYHPEFIIIPSKDDQEALEMVALKQTDAAICNLPSISYFVENIGINNLKIANETDFIYKYCFGIRKELPMLNQILSKALHSISEKERKNIVERWINFEYKRFLYSKDFWLSTLVIFGIVIMVISLYFLWNRSLRALVTIRTQELNEIKNHLEGLVDERTSQLNVTVNELEKLLNERQKFFSIIAHDLRSPFNSLIGFSDLLITNYEQFDKKEEMEIFEQINKSSKNTLCLLNNLLEWSQSQTGKIEYHPSSLNVLELFEEAALQQKEIADKKEIKISNYINPDLFIFADKRTIETVLRNLISNAIKFTYRQGSVTFSAEKTLKDDIEHIQISISDSGTGMDQEKIDNLFGFNKDIVSAGTENEKGHGLGLVLCKEFIEKNNGEIAVESELGKGSIFKILLPEYTNKSKS